MILGKPADVAQLWREKSRGDGLGLRKLDGLFVARNGEGENAVDSSRLVLARAQNRFGNCCLVARECSWLITVAL